MLVKYCVGVMGGVWIANEGILGSYVIPSPPFAGDTVHSSVSRRCNLCAWHTSLTLFTQHRFTIIITTTKQAYLHSWSGGFSHTQPAALVSHAPPTNHHHHATQTPLSTHLIHPRQLPFYVGTDPYCYRKTPGECGYIAAKNTGRRMHMLLQIYIGGRGRRTAPQPSDRVRSPSSACADRRVMCDV